jgi:hypothetical protein
MKAIVAMAASLLTAAYSMLRDDQHYHDLGVAHFQRGDHDRLVAGLTRRPKRRTRQLSMATATATPAVKRSPRWRADRRESLDQPGGAGHGTGEEKAS